MFHQEMHAQCTSLIDSPRRGEATDKGKALMKDFCNSQASRIGLVPTRSACRNETRKRHTPFLLLQQASVAQHRTNSSLLLPFSRRLINFQSSWTGGGRSPRAELHNTDRYAKYTIQAVAPVNFCRRYTVAIASILRLEYTEQRRKTW